MVPEDFTVLTGFLFQEYGQPALEHKLTFTKNRSKKLQTSCLSKPPRNVQIYPNTEKVMESHTIIAGLVKGKQSYKGERISKYFLLKMGWDRLQVRLVQIH